MPESPVGRRWRRWSDVAAPTLAALVAVTRDVAVRQPVSVRLTTPLASLLAAHGLAGRVMACSPPGETEATRMLAEQARATALVSMQVAAASARVASAARDAGIDALVYKGAALSVALDEPVSERLSTDVDVLVAKPDVEPMSALVAGLGFSPRVRYRAPARPLQDWMSIERTFDGPGPSVDLHWAVTWPSAFQASFDDLWRRRTVIPIAGVPVPTMDPVDALLVTCLHGTRSSWFQWKWLVDAGRQCRQLSADQLSRARGLASATGCERALAVTLAMLEEMGVVTGDPRTAPSPAARRLARQAIESSALHPRLDRRSVKAALARQAWRWRTCDTPAQAVPVIAGAGVRETLRRALGDGGRSPVAVQQEV